MDTQREFGHRGFGQGGRRLLIMLALAGGLLACGDGRQEVPAPADARRIVVEAVPVERHPVAAHYQTTAALEAPNEALVVARASGVLLRLLAEEGDVVKAGQVLAKLDPARSRLEVQRAEALLRKLEAEQARAKTLFERKLIAADMYEKLRYDLDTQRAVYEMARLELSHTDIVAPISGVIAQRQVKPGNLIQLNSSLFRIVDTSQLEAVLNVPEREMAAIVEGAPVSLQVDALPEVRFAGQVRRISPVIDAGSGTFRVVCGFDPDARLRPGMFGRIAVLLEERPDVLTVPRSALLEGQGEAAVFRLHDGQARRTPVVLGHASGERVEIRAGLEAQDWVITTGKLTLRDGVAVTLAHDGAAAAGTAAGAASRPAPAQPADGAAADTDTAADTERSQQQ